IIPTDKPYLQTSAFATWKARIPWLLLLMISATFTGIILTKFENALAAHITLSAFIPMLMDTGGNSGSQAAVSVIRSISLGELEFKDIFRVIWKEVRVAVLCGVTLAAVNFVKFYLIDYMLIGNMPLFDPVTISVVCITVAVTVVIAKVIGCTLPIFADKLGFDPAVMASPFITTIVDALSLLVYFSIATRMLHF
ncbi:MAG: magnesium transporter, partial [Clostridia bacterium]|nr:magnesium transporter [Clostridia bacterium]